MNAGDTVGTQTDLREPLQQESVASVGYRDAVTLPIDAELADAVQLMRTSSVGCLLVVDDGELRGIFTERDVVTRVSGKVDSLHVPLRDFMTPDPVTVRADEPIHAALTRMHQGGMRHLPVLDASGKPVGTMSVKRAVHFLADHYPQAVFNVAPDPERFPVSREGG